ncbi:sigma 54-interacting transcriptional regulator, partial [Oleiphilus sp. HI0086]
MKRKLLIVEDDPGLQSQMRWCFEGVDVHLASDREAALSILRREEPQVVTLDLGLPPDPGGSSEGFQALEEILRLAPTTKVIVVTGREEKENAVKAVGLGASDFFQKPLDADILSFIVDRAFRMHELEKQNQELSTGSSSSRLAGIIASSSKMLEVCRMIEKIAPADVTTLLLGETGTGKEVLAKAIHQVSPRQDNPFVAINCGAIPENLLESELFGHEK